MEFFNKLIRKEDIEFLFPSQEEETVESISVGEMLLFAIKYLIRFMNLWCNRIDKVIEIDKRVNGHPTWITKVACIWRGFTYKEYSALHNPHIKEEAFPFYPVFNQLNQNNGGINTEKQRADFTFQYSLNEEDYLKVLRENGYQPVLEFFFGLKSFPVLLPLKQMFAHTEIVAPSGYGKSEMLKAMFYQMQKRYRKYSFVLIDPHSSLAKSVKRFNLNKNHNRLVYIDPTFKEGYTPTFNPFELGDNQSLSELTHTAEQIITAFEEVLNRNAKSPMSDVMLNALEKCIYFLLTRPNSSFDDLWKLLEADEELLAEAKEYSPAFFNGRFGNPGNATREGLLHRFGITMNSPILRNFLSGRSTFDFESALNSGKVIILDLGNSGELTQVAIGKLFVASIKSLVRKREKNRGLPTFLFIDEVHLLMSGSFDYILSQLRGYGLHLIMSHQYFGQLGKQAESVMQNTAIKIVGGEDVDEMRKATKVPKDAKLDKFEFFVKVRHRELVKFKSPDQMVKNEKKYELSEKELINLDNLMLERFYKAIGSETERKRVKKPLAQEKKKDNTESKTNPPIPPFRLLINKKR